MMLPIHFNASLAHSEESMVKELRDLFFSGSDSQNLVRPVIMRYYRCDTYIHQSTTKIMTMIMMMMMCRDSEMHLRSRAASSCSSATLTSR